MATQNIYALTDTWNAGGTTFTGIGLNVTDTASAAGSLLIDLQVGAASRFSVSKSAAAQFLSANLKLGAADAAIPVAQTLGVQSVVAGTTNTAGASFTIAGSRGTGTGAGGSLIFQVASAGSSGSAQNALAAALTIGSDKSATFASYIVSSGQIVTSSYVAAGAAGAIQWSARSQMFSPSDGVIGFYNSAQNDFTRLQFGGATNSFGAIARDGAGVSIVGAAGGSTAHIKVPGVTVANLPAAATAGAGARSFVTDALAPVFGSAVTGGGAVNVPVYSTGAAWFVG
jgi:hypothetical protein